MSAKFEVGHDEEDNITLDPHDIEAVRGRVTLSPQEALDLGHKLRKEAIAAHERIGAKVVAENARREAQVAAERAAAGAGPNVKVTGHKVVDDSVDSGGNGVPDGD